MSYGRNEWKLDFFTMNTPQPNYEAWLQAEDGFWDTPGVNSTKTTRVNAHGSVVSPVYKTERSISLDGRAYAKNDRDVKRLAQAIKGLCSDPHRTYRLSTKTELGELETQVRLDGPILVDSGEDLSSSITFSIQLVAPDPRIYDAVWQTMETGLPQDTAGGMNFEFDSNTDDVVGLDFEGDGVSFGTSSGQTGNIRLRNTGSAPAPVVFTLHGPLSHPVITNMHDGTSMRYNDDLAEGEFVVIDPMNPSVLLGGAASRRHLMYPARFQNFVIPPASPLGASGELRVGLTHSGPITDTGKLEATWRSASW